MPSAVALEQRKVQFVRPRSNYSIWVSLFALSTQGRKPSPARTFTSSYSAPSGPPFGSRLAAAGFCCRHPCDCDTFRIMEFNKTTLERAFEIARSGGFRTIADLRSQLKHEGYAVQQLDGRALSKQLLGIARKSRQNAGRI